jgi:hypothetical protein
MLAGIIDRICNRLPQSRDVCSGHGGLELQRRYDLKRTDYCRDNPRPSGRPLARTTRVQPKITGMAHAFPTCPSRACVFRRLAGAAERRGNPALISGSSGPSVCDLARVRRGSACFGPGLRRPSTSDTSGRSASGHVREPRRVSHGPPTASEGHRAKPALAVYDARARGTRPGWRRRCRPHLRRSGCRRSDRRSRTRG